MIENLIAPIVSAASKAIASAVRYASQGDLESAKLIVKRFVAATSAELKEQENEARKILDDRFDGE